MTQFKISTNTLPLRLLRKTCGFFVVDLTVLFIFIEIGHLFESLYLHNLKWSFSRRSSDLKLCSFLFTTQQPPTALT